MWTVTPYHDLSGLVAEHAVLGRRWFYGEGVVPVLVTGNETNCARVFATPNDEPFVKDGIDRFVVHGEEDAVDPSGIGTKAALYYKVNVPAESSATAFPPDEHGPGEKQGGRDGGRRSLR